MGKGIIHTDITKIRCAYLYASLGNYSQVARDTSISRKSIMNWAKDSEVWAASLLKARQEISDELLAQNLAIAMAANVQVMDRVENGDYKITKDGTVRLPMTGKDLAVVSGIKEDKSRVAQNLATSVSTTSGSIEAIAETFRQLSQSWKEKQVNVISEQ